MTKQEKARKELKATYFDLINLVEEFKFNKVNAATQEQKDQCQKEIDSLEDRISGILYDVAILNKELGEEN